MNQFKPLPGSDGESPRTEAGLLAHDETASRSVLAPSVPHGPIKLAPLTGSTHMEHSSSLQPAEHPSSAQPVKQPFGVQPHAQEGALPVQQHVALQPPTFMPPQEQNDCNCKNASPQQNCQQDGDIARIGQKLSPRLWLLFVLGWLCPPCWFGGAIVGFGRRRNAEKLCKKAWIANIVMALLCLAVGIALGVYFASRGKSDTTPCCQNGQYHSGMSCLQCPVGSTTTGAAAATVDECNICLVGYGTSQGSSSCSLCQAGTYSSQNATGPCYACPSNTTSAAGATTASACVQVIQPLPAGRLLASRNVAVRQILTTEIDVCAGVCVSSNQCMLFRYDVSNNTCEVLLESATDDTGFNAALKIVRSGDDVSGSESVSRRLMSGNGAYVYTVFTLLPEESIGDVMEHEPIIIDVHFSKCRDMCDQLPLCELILATRVSGKVNSDTSQGHFTCQLMQATQADSNSVVMAKKVSGDKLIDPLSAAPEAVVTALPPSTGSCASLPDVIPNAVWSSGCLDVDNEGTNCVAVCAAGYSGKPVSRCTNGTWQPVGGMCDLKVDCYGTWDEWTDCNVTCGTGIRTRTYSVSNLAANGGAECPFVHGTVEYQACNTTTSCAKVGDCVGGYSDWGPCSAACDAGNGVGNRTRKCIITTEALPNGTQCPCENGTVEYSRCERTCPIDCVGFFTAWSACNATCDTNGTQTRVYKVQVEALNDGIVCDIANGAEESRTCSRNCSSTAYVDEQLSDCGTDGRTLAAKQNLFRRQDDSYTGYQLPFNVTIWNATYDRIQITTNAVIAFGSSISRACYRSNLWLTNDTACWGTGPAAAVFFDDLVPDNVLVYDDTSDPTNPYVVIQWTNMMFYNTVSYVGTFQAYVFQNGDVGYVYNDIYGTPRAHGNNAAIGLLGPLGLGNITRTAISYSFRQPVLQSGTAIITHPNGTDGYTDFQPWFDALNYFRILYNPNVPARPVVTFPTEGQAVTTSALKIQWIMADLSTSLGLTGQFRLYISTNRTMENNIREPRYNLMYGGSGFDIAGNDTQSSRAYGPPVELRSHAKYPDYARNNSLYAGPAAVLLFACTAEGCSKSCPVAFRLTED